MATARGEKPARQEADEAARRAARALNTDRAPHPDDGIPVRLHTRSLNDAGIPEFAHAFLWYVSGDEPRSGRDRQWAAVLREVQAYNRPMWTLLMEHFFFKQSYAAIAAATHVSDRTVQTQITCGLRDIQARKRELFG